MNTCLCVIYSIICIFSTIICISGFLLYAYGIFYLQKSENFDMFWDFTGRQEAPAFFMGLFMILISTMGCCGVINRNSSILGTYAAILILLFFLDITFVLELLRKDIGHGINSTVVDTLQKGFLNQSGEHMDELQRRTKCCGIYGPDGVVGKNQTRANDDFCTNNYKIGCAKVIIEYMMEKCYLLGVLFFVAAVSKIVVTLFISFLLSFIIKYSNVQKLALQ